MNGHVWEKIKLLESPTKTEKALIDKLDALVIEDLIYTSITELSDITGVAEATIVRFCRKVGFGGYHDFKLMLSKDLSFRFSSTSDSLPQNIANNMYDAIKQTAENFNYEECKRIAARLMTSRRVCVFAAGHSGSAAEQMRNRLLKIGIFVDCLQDAHFQNMLAAGLCDRDLMILISVSGSTKDIINIADIGRKLGVPIALITNSIKSPLSKRADYLLYSAKREAPFDGGAFATVVAQTYIIDILCSEVYRQLGTAAEEAVSRSREAVIDKLV